MTYGIPEEYINMTIYINKHNFLVRITKIVNFVHLKEQFLKWTNIYQSIKQG